MKTLLTDWLFEHENKLSLSLIENVYVKRWIPGQNDYMVKFFYNDKVIEGRGQSINQNLALEKAAAEALERLAWETQGPRLDCSTTNGWAAHTKLENAVENAKLELIERDHFICHFLTKTPFTDISDIPAVKNILLYSNLRPKLKKQGIEIKIGLMPSEFGVYAIICCAFGHKAKYPFGTMIGLSSSRVLEKAIEKSVSECLFGLMPLLAGSKPLPMSPKKIKALKTIEQLHHDQFGLHLINYQMLYPMFVKNKIPVTVNFKKDDSIFKFEHKQISLPKLFKDCPAKIVYARNESLQNLCLGKLDLNKINLERFYGFLKNRKLPQVPIYFDNILPFG